jgi:hypothetical protein
LGVLWGGLDPPLASATGGLRKNRGAMIQLLRVCC